MADDPYKVLGVSKTASKDEIRKAYRDLAKKYHPDVKPGDKAAEEKFKKATSAFNILSDPEKRKRYDRGEIDAEGNERGPFAGAGAGAGPRGDGQRSYSYSSQQGGFEDIGDIFADLFGRGGGPRPGAGGGRSGFRAKGDDVRYKLTIDFLEAARGASKTVTMADGSTINLKIPAGIESGKTLRLSGQGQPGVAGGPAGDAYVEVTVRDHPHYSRDGLNIRLDLPVTLKEAVEGAKITAPTIHGPVQVSVPPNSSGGSTLRLRGKGIKGKSKSGDALIRLKIVLPDDDPDLTRFVKGWSPKEAGNPRKHLMNL